MRLVDFRFVDRSVPAPEFGENIGRNVRVLQVRHRDINTNIDDGVVHANQNMSSARADDHNWSRWEDVPFVPPEDE